MKLGTEWGRTGNIKSQIFESNEPLGFSELLEKAAKFVNRIEIQGGYLVGIDRNFGTSEITGECDISLIVFYELWDEQEKD